MRIPLSLVLASGLALALAGCEQPASRSTADTKPAVRDKATPDTTKAPDKMPDYNQEPADPDNTGVNRRDAKDPTILPIDQKENQADVKRTAEIRKRVVAEPGMSINGQNCKIVTIDGKVTLRGPVASAEEKDTIGKIAIDIAGEPNVNNLLEVAP